LETGLLFRYKLRQSPKTTKLRSPSSALSKAQHITMTSNVQADPAHVRQSQIEMESASMRNDIQGTPSLLSPSDTGKDAWRFLAAGLVIEIMIWGEL
jgi:hypothetical protein